MQGYSRPRLAVAAVAASAASLGGLALGAAPAHAAGNTITVGPGGTYAKITDALAHANAGDTVSVATGAYSETVTAKPGVAVIVAPAAVVSVTGISVVNAKGAVIDGFKVGNVQGTAIKISGDDSTTIVRNNVVSNSGMPSDDATLPVGGVSGSNGVAAVTIDGAVTFTGNTVGNSRYIGVLTSGPGGATISSNEVFNNNDTNPNARFAAGISVKAPNVTVAGNYSHDNQDSGIQFYGGPTGGDNGVAVNNVVYNNGDHGIDNLNVTGGTVINNTVVHNQTAGINVEGTSKGYVVENNISSDNAYTGTAANRSKGDIRIAQDATQLGGATVNHNLVFDTAAGSGILYDWDTNGISNPPMGFVGVNTFFPKKGVTFTGVTGQGANDKSASPGFLGATNFHIATASPAANLADQAVAHKPATDKDGNAWSGSAGAYNAGSTGGPTPPPPPPPGGGGTGTGPGVQRIGGTDRFDTGVLLSRKQFPNGAKDVIIATGYAFPDALSGVPLAKHLNAPLLLIDGKNGTPEVKAEIARLLAGGGTLHVLGGVNAISETVANDVLPAGATKARIAGATRYETSVAIAQALGSPKNVVVARGDDGVNLSGFADALSAGPYAANVFGGGNGAVLLSSNTTLDPAVKNYLAGATSIQGVGGPAAAAVLGLPNTKTGIIGADRYDTAGQVAALFTTEKTAGVAYGLKFPDALTGAAFLANSDGPLVLTDSAALPGYTATRLQGIGAALGTAGTIEVFGGPAVITENTRGAVATASGGHLI